jgi:hypothetical protein
MAIDVEDNAEVSVNTRKGRLTMEAETKTVAGVAKVEIKDDKMDVAVPVKEEPKLPSKIKMTRMWGFIDKKGVNRMWQAGQVVDSADEIQMLHDCKFTSFVVVE